MENVKFDKNELAEWLKNQIDGKLAKDLKIFFTDPEVQSWIEKRDFDSLYSKWTLVYDWKSCFPTAVLLLSGIDFIPLIQSLPRSCFELLPITELTITSNVKALGRWLIDQCSKLTQLRYEGTLDNWALIFGNDVIQEHISSTMRKDPLTFICFDAIKEFKW